MCCFATALLLAGPRLAMLVWWITNPSEGNHQNLDLGRNNRPCLRGEDP
jgi:hypothetical protein